ncbi:MAG: hypothetical protein GY810_01160 [Aureispira sp.]|nr:hypothetical protein [Aureispira sp.]
MDKKEALEVKEEVIDALVLLHNALDELSYVLPLQEDPINIPFEYSDIESARNYFSLSYFDFEGKNLL